MSTSMQLLRRQINQGKADAIRRAGNGLLSQGKMQVDFVLKCKMLWQTCQTDGWKNVLLPMLEIMANPFNAYSEELHGYDEKKLLTSNIATELLLKIESMYSVAERANELDPAKEAKN